MLQRNSGIVHYLVFRFLPLYFEVGLRNRCRFHKLHIVDINLLRNYVRLFQPSLIIVIYVTINNSKLRIRKTQLRSQHDRLERTQIDTLSLLQHQHRSVGSKLNLNVQQINFRVVDQQNLEKQVIFVHPNKSLRVERIERTSQLHHRSQFTNVVHLLRTLLQNIIDLLLIVVELVGLLPFPEQSEVYQIFRILLNHLHLLIVEGEIQIRLVYTLKQSIL